MRPLLAWALLVACSTSAHACRAQAGGGEGVAVVELFGSEGCSSCPPADRLVQDRMRKANALHEPIHLIAYQVPIWDHLGWKDRFARRQWELRQREYGRRLQDGVFTPQCVVNGRWSFTGSDAAMLDARIQESLDDPVEVTISGSARTTEPEGIAVDYTLSGPIDGREINVVLVEDGLDSQVTRGENAGEHLVHEAVARAMRTVPLDELHRSGHVVLPTTDVESHQRLRVILFVQDIGQGPVRGAISVRIGS
ncbi:MAG: DUF1223 domain-containing protein [Flavobacteriales bacterium]|nr:DUF1223 domain-containing protein [Flavobacteriales bacterium]MCB9166929.1 DUF1223 domain-containing protein [Flavobacteriales bacterium]